MKTVNNIYLNIEESDYSFKIGELTFYFSSLTYLNKFKSGYKEFIAAESLKLENRYNIYCNFWLYFLIVFYNKIEKRGFKILNGNDRINDNKTFLNVDFK